MKILFRNANTPLQRHVSNVVCLAREAVEFALGPHGNYITIVDNKATIIADTGIFYQLVAEIWYNGDYWLSMDGHTVRATSLIDAHRMLRSWSMLGNCTADDSATDGDGADAFLRMSLAAEIIRPFKVCLRRGVGHVYTPPESGFLHLGSIDVWQDRFLFSYSSILKRRTMSLGDPKTRQRLLGYLYHSQRLVRRTISSDFRLEEGDRVC